MSEEQDSWFKDAFGLDLGQAAQKIRDEASAAAQQVTSTVTQVVQTVQGVVNEGIDGAIGAVTGVVKKAAGAAGVGPPGGGSGGGSGGASGGGGTGKFPLGGSVGRGGKNAPGDVRAVQAALGIAADGQCGGQTIAAIEGYQRNTMGVAKPDGRVDAGGATERALAGGGKGAAAPKGASGGEAADDLAGKALAGAKAFAGTVAGGVLGGLPGGLPGKAIDLAKDLAGEFVQGAGGLLEDAQQLGGELIQGVQGAASAALGSPGSLLSKVDAPAPSQIPQPSNPFDVPEVRLEVERLALTELRELAADHANKASTFWNSALDQARAEFKEEVDREEKEREAEIGLVITVATLAGGPLLTTASSAAAKVLNGQEVSTRLNVAVDRNIANLAQRAGLNDAQSREAWVREAREKLAMDWISAKLEAFDESKAQAGISAVAGAVKDKAVKIAAETDLKKLGVAFCDELQRAQNESMSSLLNSIRAQNTVEGLSGVYAAFASATVAEYKAAISAQIANFKSQIADPLRSQAKDLQGGQGAGNQIVKMNAYGRMRFAHVRYLPSSANYVFHSWVTPDMEAMAAKMCVGEIDPKTIAGHLPAPELQPNPARVVQMDAWGQMRLAIVSVADEGLFIKDYGVMRFVRWVPDRERSQAEAKGRAQVGGINIVSPASVKDLRPPK